MKYSISIHQMLGREKGPWNATQMEFHMCVAHHHWKGPATCSGILTSYMNGTVQRPLRPLWKFGHMN